MELSDDFESVGKDKRISNRTTIVMKILRKQLNIAITRDLLKCDNLMIEKFHKRPRYFEDFRELLIERVRNGRAISIESNRKLMQYDPFYLFKYLTNVDRTNAFNKVIRFIFLQDNGTSLKLPSPFLSVWKGFSTIQLESVVNICKEFWKTNFNDHVQATFLYYYQMPYEIHDGQYKTAFELVAIDLSKWMPRFFEEFNCGPRFQYLLKSGWVSTVEGW